MIHLSRLHEPHSPPRRTPLHVGQPSNPSLLEPPGVPCSLGPAAWGSRAMLSGLFPRYRGGTAEHSGCPHPRQSWNHSPTASLDALLWGVVKTPAVSGHPVCSPTDARSVWYLCCSEEPCCSTVAWTAHLCGEGVHLTRKRYPACFCPLPPLRLLPLTP